MPENLTHMSALGNDFIVIDAISNQCDISKMIKNRVIVFGGTGFIGKSFTDLLSKKKIE